MTIPNDEEGQRAEDVVDAALERAAMGCGDAITTCKEAIQYLRIGNQKPRRDL